MKWCLMPYQISVPAYVPEKFLCLYTMWKYVFCFTMRPSFHLRFSHVMFQYSCWIYVINIHKKQPWFPEKMLGCWIYTACYPTSSSCCPCMSDIYWPTVQTCAFLTQMGVRKDQPTSEQEGPGKSMKTFGRWYTFSFSVCSAHTILSPPSSGLL